MAIENTDTIQGLNAASPSGSEPTNEGDDQLRQLKSVLKNIMPGANGQGWALPITATEVELNYSSGVTSSIQTQLDNLADSIGNVPGYLYAPAGTTMLFYQNVAPVGWTASLDFSAHMIVATAPGYSGIWPGGTHNPLGWSHSHGTNAMALNTNQIPAHTHQMVGDANVSGSNSVDIENITTLASPLATQYNWGDTKSAGGGQPHTHGNTLPADFTPFAALVIVCVKDDD